MVKTNVVRFLVLFFSAGTVFAQDTPPDDPVGAGLNALPIAHYLHLFTDAEREAYERLLAIDDEQLDALLASDDPWKIGLGIYAASAREDLRRLLELAPLLEDDRPTIPIMSLHQNQPIPGQSARGSGDYETQRITVAQLLNTQYLTWFRISIRIPTPEEKDNYRRRFGPSMGGYDAMGQFERLLGGVDDPDQLVQPWLTRLFRAPGRATPDHLQETKNRIRQLPTEIRWAVLAAAYDRNRIGSDGGFTDAELVEEFLRLPESMRTAGLDELEIASDPTAPEHTLNFLRKQFIDLRVMALDSQPRP